MVDKSDAIKSNGFFHMNDASSMPEAQNISRAECKIHFSADIKKILLNDGVLRQDIITAAKIAGIQAAKKTSDFIPLRHSNKLTWADISFDIIQDHLKIINTVKAVSRSGLDMEALTGASAAALTVFDLCREYDTEISIQDLKIIPQPKEKGKKLSIKTPIRIGVIVISDRVIAGLAEDEAGKVLQRGFKEAGYNADHYEIISNDSDKLVDKIQNWLEKGIELIITTGGNGIGPRDITLTSLEPFFDYRLEGIEQTLHSIAQINNQGFYIDRLAVGKIGKSIVICLPLDPVLANDTLNILIPNIHLAFEF
jgi:molybdenum cofactor biosynthesis protein MoaC